jgi:hypothetical protein
MTKVEIEFALARPLDDALLNRVAAAHSLYGILRVRPSSSLDRLTVEFDASRLSTAEVESALQRAGIPIAGARLDRSFPAADERR